MQGKRGGPRGRATHHAGRSRGGGEASTRPCVVGLSRSQLQLLLLLLLQYRRPPLAHRVDAAGLHFEQLVAPRRRSDALRLHLADDGGPGDAIQVERHAVKSDIDARRRRGTAHGRQRCGRRWRRNGDGEGQGDGTARPTGAGTAALLGAYPARARRLAARTGRAPLPSLTSSKRAAGHRAASSVRGVDSLVQPPALDAVHANGKGCRATIRASSHRHRRDRQRRSA